MRLAPKDWAAADFIGGHPALDFVNTAAGRDVDPRDRLDSYARLLDWAAASGRFAARDIEALARRAKKDAPGADAALKEARLVREALFATFDANLKSAPAPKPALALIERVWRRAAAQRHLEAKAGAIASILSAEDAGPGFIAAIMAEDAIALFADARLARLRMCDGADCGWFFLDTSKNNKRRWCDMAVCGNAAKARRHYARHKGE